LHPEKTPAATLALHWVITNILVLACVLSIRPEPYSPIPAYTFLASIYAYVIDVAFFMAVGLGLLWLRLSPSAGWADKSQFKHPWVSTIASLVFFLTSLVPLVLIWIPDPAVKVLSRTGGEIPWFASQTVGICVLFAALIYWLGFRSYVQIRSNREGRELEVTRQPIFRDEGGFWTLIYEIVTWKWNESFRNDVRLDEISGGGGEEISRATRVTGRE
jgi:hypothetical protein